MMDSDLTKLIWELQRTSPKIWEDIAVVKCESGEKFRTNKTLIFLNWPFLAETLESCDLIIIDAPQHLSEQINLIDACETDSPEGLVWEGKETNSNFCEQCGKNFPSPSKLKKHRTNAHQDVACQFCGKRYSSLGALNRHLEVHKSGPMKCEICGKEIRYSSNYDRHVQTHFSIFKFECSNCQLKFETRQGLQQHEKIHNPESFSCPLCNKHFNNSRYLSQHLKKCNIKH